jgi:hypothetical protein
MLVFLVFLTIVQQVFPIHYISTDSELLEACVMPVVAASMRAMVMDVGAFFCFALQASSCNFDAPFGFKRYHSPL